MPILTVERGEIVLLRGPNGAGKTSLLRLCAGLLPVERGTAIVLGCDLAADRTAVRNRVGLLGHSNGLYADLTVADNVALLGRHGRRDQRTRSAHRWPAWASPVGWPTCRWVGSAPASAAARRSPAWSPAGPSCGCSTSRTPASTPPAATTSTRTLRERRGCRRHGDGGQPRAGTGRGPGQPCGRSGRRPGATARWTRMSTWRIARLVAAKDLRIEWRSRVVINQVLPFAALVMVMFAFALDNDNVLTRVAPGLVWLATMFSLLVMVQRAFAVETADGALDALQVAGVRPGGIFLGKSHGPRRAARRAGAGAAGGGRRALPDRDRRPAAAVLLVTTFVAATTGLAFVGTLYGGLAAGAKGRETLLPLLMLPVVAPVLIGATRATEAALGTEGATSK